MSTQGNPQLISSAKAFSRTASAGLILLGGLVLIGWALAVPALGVVLMAAGASILFVVLVWMNAATLDRLDIERKRREEALRDSEERYRRLVETAKDVIFTVSTDGTFTSLNPAFETVTDWSRTEWLEKSFVPFVHPDDRPRALEIFHQLLRGETPPLSELRVLFKSGAVHTWEFTATPQFREKAVESILVIVRDVSERRQVEEALRKSEIRFRTIFETAAIGIGLSNMEGRLVRSNPALHEMLGYSGEELREQVFTAFTYPEDREADWGLFQELVANKREDYQREKRYIRKDGSLIWARLTVSLIRGIGGEPQFAVGMVEDITAHKQAEEALRRSEEYFRALIENASDIITILSAEGTIRYESPPFERTFGYAPGEVIGRNAVGFVHPEDLEKVRNAFARRIQIPGHTASVEFRFLHKDGSWRVLESIGKNMLDNPAVKGIIINSRDVTERKHAEQALRESEERFRLLSASSPIGIFSNDIEGACLYTNPCWQEIAGMTLEESLDHGWADAIAPEDRESVVAEWQACVREGREFTGEFRFIQPSGEARWVRTRAVGLRSDSGALLGYVGTTEDITERRQARIELERLRHQLELILTSVADGIYVLDRQGKTTFMNPAAVRMLGYRTEELIGLPMHGLVHHSKPDGTLYPSEECQIYAALADGAVHHVTNEVFWRKDGSSFPVEYHSAPIHEQGGEIIGAAVTFRDISERRAVERMKDEFISVVSHELRTPLTSIRGALGLLSSGLVGALPDKGQRMLEIAVNNTDRLVRLINDILDIERMQSGKVLMQYRLCEAAALLNQASDEMRALADKAEVTLVVAAQSLRLWADPDRLVQTLTNLLSNALKFSPPQTTVQLSVRRQGQDAVFTVQDQGRGIPANKLDSVFERFQQVDASDSRQKGGTGLGLTICRSIVQQHGGRIWVESEPDRGSTFSFTVPVWKEAERGLTAPAGRPLVLACDDDPAVLEVVAAVLEPRGYQVVTVTTGQEAVAQAEARQPAVILLDLLMPQMNGWDTMAALKRKSETRNIPIIIFSILSPPETTPLPSNCVGWVQKSLGETVLFEALKRALDERAKVAQVLVVEDDLDLARVLLAMFQRHGIKTAHAGTGREAIAACEQRMPDLLVLDLILPDGDGFMVADWLRQQDQLRQVPLVVYSAKDLDAAERERLQLGHTEFFTKGRITPREFEQQIVAWLDRIILAKAADATKHETQLVGSH